MDYESIIFHGCIYSENIPQNNCVAFGRGSDPNTRFFQPRNTNPACTNSLCHSARDLKLNTHVFKYSSTSNGLRSILRDRT